MSLYKKKHTPIKTILCLLFLLIPLNFLSASAFPDEISNKSRISILSVNYTDFSHSLFSKNCLRIYDKENDFDQLIDFAQFDNFDDNFFLLKFIFNEKKAKIRTQTFIDYYLEYSKKNNVTLTEINLLLSQSEIAYIYSFLKTVHDALPNYEYDFDILSNNSETHISQILHDCYRMTGNKPQDQYSFDTIWEHKLKLHRIEDSFIFLNERTTLSLDKKVTENAFNIEKPSLVILFTVLSALIFIFTVYQVLVYFFEKLYLMSIFKTVQIFDFLILFIAGIAGTIILFLDIFSEQTLFRNNFQFLFLFPLHMLAGFTIFKPVNRRRLQIIYWSATSAFSLLYILISIHEFTLIHLLFTLPVFFRTLYFDFIAIDLKTVLFKNKNPVLFKVDDNTPCARD